MQTKVELPEQVPVPLQTSVASLDGHAETVPAAKPQSARLPAVLATEPPAPLELVHLFAVLPSYDAQTQTPVPRLQIPRLEHSKDSRLPCTLVNVEPYAEDTPSPTATNVGVPDDCANEECNVINGKLPD